MKIYNHDMVLIVNKLRVVRKEVARSQSSNSNFTNVHDKERLTAYFKALEDVKSLVVGLDVLDLPETSPLEIELVEIEPVAVMQNEYLSYIDRHLMLMESELLNSDSARQATGLIKYDSKRYDAILEKIKTVLNGVMVDHDPADYPETSPSAPMTPAGQQGV